MIEPTLAKHMQLHPNDGAACDVTDGEGVTVTPESSNGAACNRLAVEHSLPSSDVLGAGYQGRGPR